ncbi:hypothetical protein KEM60_00168 [Austwickia sp. TVS 96-490-7B]|nr:hypothetical protein [Austwickia sp. TVS 96-490-7B]
MFTLVGKPSYMRKENMRDGRFKGLPSRNARYDFFRLLAMPLSSHLHCAAARLTGGTHRSTWGMPPESFDVRAELSQQPAPQQSTPVAPWGSAVTVFTRYVVRTPLRVAAWSSPSRLKLLD